MNGPAHYREAERLLRLTDDHPGEHDADRLAAAQVHATLALASGVVEMLSAVTGATS